MKSELEQLREEVALLRKEVAELRADRAVHHYHHQAAPAPFVGPFVHPGSPSVTLSYPQWPGYFPATAGGSVVTDSTTPFYNGGGGTMI